MCSTLDKRGKEARELFWKLMKNQISREHFDSRITEMMAEQNAEEAIQLAFSPDWKINDRLRGGL